jgi:hypothetical protein
MLVPRPLSCSYLSDGTRQATFDPSELERFLEGTGASSFEVKDADGEIFAVAHLSLSELRQILTDHWHSDTTPSQMLSVPQRHNLLSPSE